MKYTKSRKARTGDAGTLTERKKYYDSCLKCSHCTYTNKGASKDKFKFGLDKAFANKWKLLIHYNNTHPKFSHEIRHLFKDEELVTCPICGQFMGQITDKHLAKHGIKTTDEFKKLYPDVEMRPTKIKKIWSDRCKVFNKTEFMREAVSEALLEGHKAGKYDEIKKLSSEIKKKKFASGELVIWCKGRTKHDCESLRRISDAQIKNWANGVFKKSNAGIKGYFYSNKNKQKIPYRSSYELKAFKILEEDRQVNSYQYEKLRIRYYAEDKKIHSYYPDIITSDKRIIEVKAKWIFEKQYENIDRKFRAAKRWAKKNGYKFEVWMEEELGL